MEQTVTGVMLYYYFVCPRKLWYFARQLRMEQGNENVEIGKLLDSGSYTRDEKHIQIDQVINIDFIRSSNTLHEIKKSRKIEGASIWQLKYYLYYLKQRGVDGLHGQLDYPLLKQTVQVELTAEDTQQIEQLLSSIREICGQPLPPPFHSMRICHACAYLDLCAV